MYYILLRSCEALLCGRFSIHALAGTIVLNSQLDEGQFLSLDQKDLQVYFDQKDVRELSEEECDLLVAVPQPRQRLLVLENETWMQEGLKLIQIDSEVNISKWSSNKKAKVRYKGYLPEKGKGIYFGVELEESSILTPSDGTYRDRRVFKCEPGHGDFATISEIRLDAGRPVIPPKPSELSAVKRRARNRGLQRPSSLPPLRFYPENDSPRPYSNPEEHGPLVTSSPRLWRKSSLDDSKATQRETINVKETKVKFPTDNLHSKPSKHHSASKPSKHPSTSKPSKHQSTSKSSNHEKTSPSNVKGATKTFQNMSGHLRNSPVSSKKALNHGHFRSASLEADQTTKAKLKEDVAIHQVNVTSKKRIFEHSPPLPTTDKKKQTTVHDPRHENSELNRTSRDSRKDKFVTKLLISVKPQENKSIEEVKPSNETEPGVRHTFLKQESVKNSTDKIGVNRNDLTMDSPLANYIQQKPDTITDKEERRPEDSLSEPVNKVSSPCKTNVDLDDLSDVVKTYISDMITDVIRKYKSEDKSKVSKSLNLSEVTSDIDSTQTCSSENEDVSEDKPNTGLVDSHLIRILELEKRVMSLESQLKLFEGFCGKYNLLDKYLREQRRAQEALEQKVLLLENASKRRDAIEALSERRLLSPSGTQTPKASSPVAILQAFSPSESTAPASDPSILQVNAMNENVKTGVSRTLFSPNEKEDNGGKGQQIDRCLNQREMKETQIKVAEINPVTEAQNLLVMGHTEKENKSLVNDSHTDNQATSIPADCLNTKVPKAVEKEQHDNFRIKEETDKEENPSLKCCLDKRGTCDNSIELEKLAEPNEDQMNGSNTEDLPAQENKQQAVKRNKYTGLNFKATKKTKLNETKVNKSKNEDKENVISQQSRKVTGSRNEKHSRKEVEEACSLITNTIEKKIKEDETKKESLKESLIQTELKAKDHDGQGFKKFQEFENSNKNKNKHQEEKNRDIQDSSFIKDEEKVSEPRKDQRQRVSPVAVNSYYEHWKLSNNEKAQRGTFNRYSITQPDTTKNQNQDGKTETLKTKQMLPQNRTRISIIRNTAPPSQVAKNRRTSAQERMDFLMQSLKEHSQSMDLAGVLEQEASEA